MRRVFHSALLAAVAAATVTAAVSAAQQTSNTNRQATLVMKGGERHTGTLVYHNNNNLNLIENGQDRTYPIGDVAVVDFAGGEPKAAELNQLPTSDGSSDDLQRHMLALRDGTLVHGRMYTITPNAITFNTQNGHQDFDLNNISRWYVSPVASRQLYAAQLQAPQPAPATPVQGAGQGSRTGRTGRVGAGQGTLPPAGQIDPNASRANRTRAGQDAIPDGAIQVSGSAAWTDIGITVRRGDRIGFSTSGQVSFRNGTRAVGPDGSASENRAGAPVQNVGVGGLIGRVGNGAPFAIGSSSQLITMPASGRLFLGINDSGVGDNSGAFVVTILR
jgi:hypothetical protein